MVKKNLDLKKTIKNEAINSLWLTITFSWAIAGLSTAYNHIFTLNITNFILIAASFIGGFFAWYLYQKRLRIIWAIFTILLLSFAINTSLLLWQGSISNLVSNDSVFDFYLWLDSFYKAFLFLFVAFFIVFFSLSQAFSLYINSLIIILLSLPLAVKIFDGSFYWQWEEGVIAAIWFAFFLLALGIPMFRPDRQFLWPSSKGRWQMAAKLGLVVTILFVISMVVFFTRSRENIGGVLSRSGDHFQFNPFLTLEPEVQLSYERLMVAELSDRVHIRHFLLSEWHDSQYFIAPKQPLEYETHEMKAYRHTAQSQWQRKRINEPIVGRIGLKQKYYLKKFPPHINFAANRPQEIFPLENKTPENFTAIIQSISFAPRQDIFENLDNNDGDTRPNSPGQSINNSNFNRQDFYKYYTKIGDSQFSQKVQNLAKKITNTSSQPQIQALAIQKYLQENYTYSLNPGGENIDNKLEYFIFNGKKGYCTYYAFAFAMMARSIGLPSRVAVGFLPDPRLKKFDYWWILGAQAHAWIEIYFDSLGWIPFDVPTSNPFVSVPGAAAFDIQDEVEQDIMAIEKNMGSKILEEYEKNLLDSQQTARNEKLRKISVYSFWVILLILSSLLINCYAYRFMKILIPKKSLYYRFQHLQWTWARYGNSRPKGRGWRHWASQTMEPYQADLFSEIEKQIDILDKLSNNQDPVTMTKTNAEVIADAFKRKLQIEKNLENLENYLQNYIRQQRHWQRLKAAGNFINWLPKR